MNSHRNFDDDGDGQIDEEIDNGKDDDRDGYVDEDVRCDCPPRQTVLEFKNGIDDDHDFAIDGGAAERADDDGDGCIDEDVAGYWTDASQDHVWGTVKDALGHPLAGVLVELLADRSPIAANQRSAVWGITDVGGTYTIDVPASVPAAPQVRYRIHATLRHYETIPTSIDAPPVYWMVYGLANSASQAAYLVLPEFTIPDPAVPARQDVTLGPGRDSADRDGVLREPGRLHNGRRIRGGLLSNLPGQGFRPFGYGYPRIRPPTSG